MNQSGPPPLPSHHRQFPPPMATTFGGAHRRAQSETFIPLPDDLFDSDPDFLDFPSLSGDSVRPAPPEAAPPAMGAHLRSLSVDAAFFDGLELGFEERKAVEGDSMSENAKKAMPAERLAELALVDPKRAKRILANRQSAARSKERKIKYAGELERKVQTLQTEATALSAQVTLLQRDATCLNAENRELQLRLQAMEQQAQLRDALNETLREEVQRLRIATGQLPNVNGNPFNGRLQQSAANYYSHLQQLPHVSSHQAQHLSPAQSQSCSDGQSLNVPSPNDSMEFM